MSRCGSNDWRADVKESGDKSRPWKAVVINDRKGIENSIGNFVNENTALKAAEKRAETLNYSNKKVRRFT